MGGGCEERGDVFPADHKLARLGGEGVEGRHGMR